LSNSFIRFGAYPGGTTLGTSSFSNSSTESSCPVGTESVTAVVTDDSADDDIDGILITETVPVEEDALVAATLHAAEADAGIGIMEEVQIMQIERTSLLIFIILDFS